MGGPGWGGSCIYAGLPRGGGENGAAGLKEAVLEKIPKKVNPWVSGSGKRGNTTKRTFLWANVNTSTHFKAIVFGRPSVRGAMRREKGKTRRQGDEEKL